MTSVLDRPVAANSSEYNADYEDSSKFYSDDKYPEHDWDIDVAKTDPSTVDTAPFDTAAAVKELIGRSPNAHDAIQHYIESYPRKDWTEGKVIPQDAAAVLVEIHDIFEDSMSPEERDFVLNEAVGAVHELAHMTETEENTGEIATGPDLLTVVDIIDIANEEASDPRIADATEKDLKKLLKAVKSNPDKQVFVKPIENAIERYDDPENEDPLGMIVTNLLNRQQNMSIRKLELKGKLDPSTFGGLYLGELSDKLKQSEDKDHKVAA